MAYDPRNLRHYIEHDFSYFAGFERNVARFANQPAIIDPVAGRNWSYRELGAEVGRLAAAFAELGVTRRERVVYQLFNGSEFAFCYLATQRLGAIGVPINYRLAAGEIAHILEDSTPRVYIYDTEVAATALAALQKVPVSHVITVGPGTPPAGTQEFGTLMAHSQSAAPPLPDDYSTYEETTRLYTSGTTGMPKGVPLPSLVEVLSAHDVIMHFPLAPADRTLNMTPWFHRGGLYSGGPNPAFYVGGAVVPMRSFDAATALDWVDRYGLNFLIGAPTTLEMLAAEQERQPRALKTLKGVVTMGAPLDPAAALRYQRLLTPRIFNGYGTTESFWNTFLRPEDLPARAGSAGRACTDDDVAVVHVYPDHRAAPDDTVARDGREPGEVIMRSPKSGFAYVNLPSLQEEKFYHGWLYPGDIATWDADGFVTILGRKDDMIVSGGENVHPVQIEACLATHPGVGDSVVVGVPDPRWGERVVAYVIRKDPALGAEELDAHCRADYNLANFKRPRGYRFVDTLPRTATGKKMHFKVAEWAIADDRAGRFEVPQSAKKGK
ncbi:MAG: class I adenylate-forming enzyme family protein [Gammaproteobacteria bacterium]